MDFIVKIDRRPDALTITSLERGENGGSFWFWLSAMETNCPKNGLDGVEVICRELKGLGMLKQLEGRTIHHYQSTRRYAPLNFG